MAGELTVPTTITNKAQFDEWVNNLSSDKLTTTQKDALKTDIAAKLGLDMGNAITAYGRDAIQADLNFFAKNPTATSIPKLDPDLGAADGPSQLDGLRAAANQFSDPFLIDLTAVLALMHETSEKLRSATKELREAENQNSQAQMQASAESILAAGQFQAIAGGLGAGMSIAGGASGLAGAGGGLASVKSLNTQIKAGIDDGPDPTAVLQQTPDPATTGTNPTTGKSTNPNTGGLDEVADLKSQLAQDLPTVEQNLAKLAPDNGAKSPATGGYDEVADLKNLLGKDLPTVEANLAKLDPQAKQQLQSEVAELKGELAKLDAALPKMTREEFMSASRKIDMDAQKWQSYGSMIDGLGRALSSGIQSLSSAAESAKAIYDKQASQAQFEQQTTNDLVKTLADFSQQIRQTVQAIISSQDQAAHRVANV